MTAHMHSCHEQTGNSVCCSIMSVHLGGVRVYIVGKEKG